MKAKILEGNKKLMERFLNTLTHVGESRRNDLESHLKQFSKVLGKPLDQATAADIARALNEEKGGLKTSSYRERVTAVKQFYKSIRKKRLVKNIKAPRQKKPKPVYPSAEELVKILNAPTHPRDRSLLCTGYETATAGRAKKELLAINLGAVTIQNNTAYIDIWESKTDSRRVLVKKFIVDFTHWLNIHPFNQGGVSLEELEEVPLFIAEFNPKRIPRAVKVEFSHDRKYTTVTYRNKKQSRIRLYHAPNGRTYNRLSYSSANDVMKAACRQAGTKSYTLRALRHRRSKDLERVLSIREKMAYFGWSNINTAMVYGSFTSEEACDTVLAAEEGRPPERQDEIANWKCEGCQTDNPPTARFCLNCSQPKDVKMALGLSMKAVEDIVDLVLSKVLSNSQMKSLLVEERRKELQNDREKVKVPA